MRQITEAPGAPTDWIRNASNYAEIGVQSALRMILVWASPVQPAGNVAIEAEDLKSRRITSPTQFVINTLLALCLAVRAASIVNVVKREKRGSVFATADTGRGFTAVRRKRLSAHQPASLRAISID